MTIKITNVNDKPVAKDDTFTTPEETPVNGKVLGNDSDVECTDSLTAVIVTGPKNGTFDGFTDGGVFTYTPEKDFAGTDSFVYQITDCEDKTDTATGKYNKTFSPVTSDIQTLHRI